MAEIELAALVGQCLDRRIPDMDQLRAEVLAWAHNQNEQQRTVNWTFAQHNAREKLERHYNNVRKLL